MRRTLGVVWLLCSILYSCDDIIEVKDISNHPPVILAPDNNVVLPSGAVTFSWYEVIEAETYRLQIATPNFENAMQVVEDVAIDTVNYTTTLSSGDYQWRVKAINSAYESDYSTHNLTIE